MPTFGSFLRKDVLVNLLTGSLFGVFGLGAVHEEREDSASWINFAQKVEDATHSFAHQVFGLTQLKQVVRKHNYY